MVLSFSLSNFRTKESDRKPSERIKITNRKQMCHAVICYLKHGRREKYNNNNYNKNYQYTKHNNDGDDDDDDWLKKPCYNVITIIIIIIIITTWLTMMYTSLQIIYEVNYWREGGKIAMNWPEVRRRRLKEMKVEVKEI